jgi:cytochrome bd-type quinol oxidase subunit 1
MLLWKWVLHGVLHLDDVNDDQREGDVMMSFVLETSVLVVIFGIYIWVLFKVAD